jgi:autotransporter translocation and assembly factor TamB
VKLLCAFVVCVASLVAAVQPDSEIEANIRARFAKSKISASKFQVSVRGGTATITGRTEVIQHKGVATRLAKLGGARAVDNKIQISDAFRERAAAKLAEARKSQAVAERSEPRSAPRTEKRSEARREEPGAAAEPTAPAPPPVRRAVVKR